MKGKNWKSGEKSYYKIDRKEIIEMEKNSKEFFRCAYLYQSMKIHPDGLIDPCTPRNAPTIGHVDKGIKNAWNNEKLKEMRKAHESGKWYTIDECKKCDHPYIAIFKKNNKTVKV
jgi:radical SAM protein with 4Fe4S-binding SPASM domain